MKRKTVFKNLMLISVLVLSIGAVSCGKKEEEPLIVIDSGNDTIDYELVTCTKGDVVLTARIAAQYKKNSEQEVYFPVSGKYVDKVYVREGDVVKKGDLLAELSAGNIQGEIARLKYQIKRNELLNGYADEEYLIDMQYQWLNYIYMTGQSAKDKERLDTSLENLKKQTDSKKENYGDSLEFDKKKLASLNAEYSASRVYAEFDGTVKFIADNLEGSTSNISKLAMTIVDNEEGYFASSDLKYKDMFKEGEPVPMRITVGNGKGDYRLIPADIENWDKYMKFYVFEGDVENLTADVTGDIIVTVDQRTDVLNVPSRCVYRAGKEFYVYVINEDGLRDACFVKVGLMGDDRVEILEGLKEGDSVIKR